MNKYSPGLMILLMLGLSYFVLHRPQQEKSSQVAKKSEAFKSDKKKSPHGSLMTEVSSQHGILEKEGLNGESRTLHEKFEQLAQEAKDELEKCSAHWDEVDQLWSQTQQEIGRIDKKNPPKQLIQNLLYLIKGRECSYDKTNRYLTYIRQKYRNLIFEEKLEEAFELTSHLREYSHTVLKYDSFRSILNGLKDPNMDPELKEEVARMVIDFSDNNSQRPVNLLELLTSVSLLQNLSDVASLPPSIREEIRNYYNEIHQFKRNLSAQWTEFAKSHPEIDTEDFNDPIVHAFSKNHHLREIDETERFRLQKLRAIIRKLRNYRR